MNKKEEKVELRNKKIIKSEELIYSNINSNNKTDNKQYNVQLIILDEQKKLKINLEISETNKSKSIYSTLISFEELIALNKFFYNFENYSEAFDFLLKNFTKIDRSKISYLNNNKEIKINLLFSVTDFFQIDNENQIIEESIELILQRYNNNSNKSSSIANLTLIINNLKSSLEKFNLSIKDLKSSLNNDKIDKDKKINELEKKFNLKFDEYIKNKKYISQVNNDDEYLVEIYSRMESCENEISNIIQKIEDENIKFNKSNKLVIEKENELSKLITEKFQEFINQINFLEEKRKKNEEMIKKTETNFNSKISELDSKTNIWFNELIKKINHKSNYSFGDDFNNLDDVISDKINEQMSNINGIIDNKLKIYEEQISNLNQKINNLDQGQSISFKSLDATKVTELEVKILNLENAMNRLNVIIKDEKKMNIKNNDITWRYNGNRYNLEENSDKLIDNNNKTILEEITKLKEEYKINIENLKIQQEILTKNLNDKMEQYQEDINILKNKINEDNKEYNNKILSLKIELTKSFDTNYNQMETKIKLLEDKVNSSNDNNVTRSIRDNNIIYFDKSIKEKGKKILEDNSYKPKEKDIKIKEIYTNDFNKDFFSSKINSTYSARTFGMDDNNLTTPNTRLLSFRNTTIKSERNTESNYDPERISVLSVPLSIKRDSQNTLDIKTFDSNILQPEELSEDFFLFSKIKEIYPYNKYIKFILIYRATKHGDLSKNFHSQCDFIGPNITLIKTNKGYIFGGFTIKNWKHLFKDIDKDDPDKGTEYIDEKAFGFSVNNKKIYENGKPFDYVVYCNSNYGPCFRNYFFKIYNKCFTNGGICGKMENSNFKGQESNYEINGGEEKFNVNEIEVFQIKFR